MKALVVDDEAIARRRLARLLAEQGVEVVGEAANAVEALLAIERLEPDVVFLDIRMPGLDGLALAREGRGVLPPVVFVTAYDEYAVAAFEAEAVDYLLKPVEPDRLAATVERLGRRSPGESRARLHALLARLEGEAAVGRIASRSGAGLRFFDLRRIARFSARRKRVVFRYGGSEHTAEETLDQLESRLAPLGFVRVHRAELVSLNFVAALYVEGRTATLELTTGERVPVSRRRLPALRRALGV